MVLSLVVEDLALLQILSPQRTTNYVNLIFFLGNSEVNAVVHHFSERLELLGGDVEEQDLRTGNVLRPVELVSFVPTNYQDVLLVNHHNLSFTYALLWLKSY